MRTQSFADLYAQDRDPVIHLATRAIDVSDPLNPIFPQGIAKINVSDYIVGMLYDTTKFSPADLSLDLLLYGSSHNERVSTQAQELNAFVQVVRGHLAKGRYVIVRGWRPGFDSAWDEAVVLSFKGAVEQRVEYQGKQCAPMSDISLNLHL